MKETDIIREALKSCEISQTELAKRLGYNTQSAVGNRLQGDTMTVVNFVKFLNAMGYKVVVESDSPRLNKNKWIVDYSSKSSTEVEK